MCLACIPSDSWSKERGRSRSKSLIGFLLEYVKVIDCCQCNDVILRMPGGIQDLSAEVQAVDADLVPLAPAPRAHAPGLERATGRAVLPRGLQAHVTLGVAIEHPEEVVIRARHDLAENREMENYEIVRQRLIIFSNIRQKTTSLW